MSDVWYEEVAASTTLTQGDLILNCPLVSWQDEIPQLNGSGEAERLRGMTTAIQADTVVMTQACDLENEKVQNVVLCLHSSLSEHQEVWTAEMNRKNQSPTQKAWRSYCDDIRDGFLWNLAILNAGKTATLSTEHRIVDFRDIFTVPRNFLESLLQQRGESRLRLLPPYREHLSQAFARFFMRVGLPTPIEKAW
jgi:hypothetical protein